MYRFLFIAALLTFTAATIHAQQSDKLQGTYYLYRQDSPSEKTGEMIITSWKENNFLIRGSGWVGEGEIKENKGYYKWKFDDGKTGKTEFELNADGSLSGHVVGSGINWKYIARKAKE